MRTISCVPEAVHQAQLQAATQPGDTAPDADSEPAAGAPPSPAQRQGAGECRAAAPGEAGSEAGVQGSEEGQCGAPDQDQEQGPDVTQKADAKGGSGQAGEGEDTGGDTASTSGQVGQVGQGSEGDAGRELLPDEMPLEPDVNTVDMEEILEQVARALEKMEGGEEEGQEEEKEEEVPETEEGQVEKGKKNGYI